jgi:signal transduction histidine kinase
MDRFKPFETFLIASDPVWVWDSDSASIVWANAAARQMFGMAEGTSLRDRAFSGSDPSLKRLTSLARAKKGNGQWEGDLPLPGGEPARTARCEVQRLQLTGGARGVIVRVLSAQQQVKSRVMVAEEPRSEGTRPGKKSANGASRVSRAAQPAVLSGAEKRAGASNGAKRRQALPVPPRISGQLGLAGEAPARQRRAFRAKAADMAVLAGLSHDLRNPLTAVLGFAEIMKGAKSAGLTLDKVEDYAADISKSALFALDLANSLMHYARFGRFEEPAAAAALNVCAVLQDCVRLLSPVAAFTNLTLNLRVEPDLPLLAMDERSFRQILFNLLLNSIKFGGAGSEVRIKAGTSKRGDLVVTIDDQGQGARNGTPAPKSLQIGAAAEIPSAGIGLSVVKRLLKGAGARIARRKRKTGGTSVKLIFPASALTLERKPEATVPGGA